MKPDADLERRLREQAERKQRAERERRSLLAQTTYLGSLGLVFVLPLVGGAYLGRWLDTLAPGYSVRWTIGFLLLGLVVGGMNVYLLMRRDTP
ncbi:MAG TPA: AtpZ/AtpI family protein [Gammaproteobacteria bacterium]|nr:AtpZ/AtpI family protein [Gammaproteobacteria bacterium]